MKIKYDLHIHSGLSPCADNEMSPANIVAAASARELEMIALTDHNAINNVKYTMAYGELLNIVVVPGVEITTAEDIHMICLFPTYDKLVDFFGNIKYRDIVSRSRHKYQQIIYDEDDQPCGEIERTLYAACTQSEQEVFNLAKECEGIAVPAHIDRDMYGMILVLGTVPAYYPTVEISYASDLEEYQLYVDRFNILRNSDGHHFESIGMLGSTIDLDECTPKALIDKLWKYKERKKCTCED